MLLGKYVQKKKKKKKKKNCYSENMFLSFYKNLINNNFMAFSCF